MGFLTEKKATSHTPQVVVLLIDDSASMGSESKAEQVTAAVQDLIIQLQASTQGASGARFLLNLAKFGDTVTPLAVAAPPLEIDFNQMQFQATSGATEMPQALRWAAAALQQSLDAIRRLPRYAEAQAPNPLCIFFSDGANTSREDVTTAAQVLQSIPFHGGQVDVVACGIGMTAAAFAVMQQIASNPALAVNLDPQRLGHFIAEVGATVQNDRNAESLLAEARQHQHLVSEAQLEITLPARRLLQPLS